MIITYEVDVQPDVKVQALTESVKSVMVVNASPVRVNLYADGAYHTVNPRTAVTTYSDDFFSDLQLEAVGQSTSVVIHASTDGLVRADSGLPNVILKLHLGTLARCPSLPYCA